MAVKYYIKEVKEIDNGMLKDPNNPMARLDSEKFQAGRVVIAIVGDTKNHQKALAIAVPKDDSRKATKAALEAEAQAQAKKIYGDDLVAAPKE